MLVTSAQTFKPSEHVRFTKPKVNSVGGKSIGILNATTSKPVYLSTPLLRCWGVNKRDNERSGGFNYDFSLQFDDESMSSESQKELLRTMIQFEDHIRSSAIENSKEWLGKAKMSEEVLDAIFHPMLKYPKNKETDEPDKTRAPTLKVKMPVWDGEFKFEIYDMEHERLIPNRENAVEPEDVIEKGSSVACILQCGGIWFASGKLGVTWKLVQAVVKPSVNFELGKCHIQLDDSEKRRLVEEAREVKKDASYDSDGEEVGEETQEEEEVVAEEEEEETQVVQEEVVEDEKPKKKKTGGRKKATTSD